MCGQGLRWPEMPEPEYRATWDDKAFAKVFYEDLVFGAPHSYPRDKSIGHFLLELRASRRQPGDSA